MPMPDSLRCEADEPRLVDISLPDLAGPLVLDLLDNRLRVVFVADARSAKASRKQATYLYICGKRRSLKIGEG